MNLILSHLIKKKADSVLSHKRKIWFCLISLKKNLILFHLIKKRSCLILVLIQNRIESEWEILILVISLNSITVEALQIKINNVYFVTQHIIISMLSNS